MERSQTAGRIPAGPAYLTVDVVSAVPAPGQIATVDLATKKSPVEWKKTKSIHTVDGDTSHLLRSLEGTGGSLQWDPKTGRARVGDHQKDGHLVRGYVIADGKVVASMRAGEKGKYDEAAVPDYKRSKKYELKVCLARSDKDPDGYCNYSTNTEWPHAERKKNYCEDLDGDQAKISCVGGVQEYCHLSWETDAMFPEQCVKDHTGKASEALKPPSGPTHKPSINDRPDADLPRGQPAGASSVAQPVGVMLRWLVWTSLGACVLGIILVGGNMAIKHKRGEAGAHATDLGWVLIACVVAGSGLAIAFISLLVKPL